MSKSSEIADFDFKNTEDLNFRFALVQDIKQLLAVERDVYEEIPWTASHFEYEIAVNPYSIFIVVENEQKIIGYIGIRWNKQRTDLHLSNFIVMKSWQQKGIGSRLFEHAVEIARLLKISKMSLEVVHNNLAAQGFYRKRGFESARILSAYYTDESDAVEMEKYL